MFREREVARDKLRTHLFDSTKNNGRSTKFQEVFLQIKNKNGPLLLVYVHGPTYPFFLTFFRKKLYFFSILLELFQYMPRDRQNCNYSIEKLFESIVITKCMRKTFKFIFNNC